MLVKNWFKINLIITKLAEERLKVGQIIVYCLKVDELMSFKSEKLIGK